MALADGTVARRGRVEPWPLVVMGLLVGMGVVLGLFLRTAIVHRDTMVVDDAYAAGLRLSSEIEAGRRVAARGWDLELAAAPEAEAVRVQVRLVADGAAPAPERVVLRRERPAEGGLDRSYELTPAGDGSFAGLVPLPRPGRWHLEARAEVGGEAVVRRFRVDAPGPAR